MSTLDWAIVANGIKFGLEGHRLTNAPWLGAATGAGLGMGAVILTDQLMNKMLMKDNTKEWTPLQAGTAGAIEDTIASLAMSIALGHPMSGRSVGIAALYGMGEEIIIHGSEGNMDWQHPFGWN